MSLAIDKRVLRGSLLILLGSVSIFWALRSWEVIILGLTVLIIHAAFFREPSPFIPEESHKLLSPADGRITEISRVNEKKFLGQEAVKIGIFLSVFDPHVTRAPWQGTVEYLQYVPGDFFNALRARSTEFNESNWIGIEYKGLRILVRQMAGAIARKIFCDVSLHSRVAKGQKLGIICYGSRVECYVPVQSCELTVQVGDRVKAGQTILGEIKTK